MIASRAGGAISHAAELTVLASQGNLPGVNELATAFARASGHKVTVLQEVGKALACYLQRARPRCASRRVFVRARAPRQGFANSSAICCVAGSSGWQQMNNNRSMSSR